ALVDRNAMQPGGNPGLAPKAAQVSERGQKRLLGGITCILFPPEHAESQSEYAALPALHNFAKGVGVTRQRALNHLFVVRGRFHSVRRSRPPRSPSKCRAPSNTMRVSSLDAPRRRQVEKVSHEIRHSAAPIKNVGMTQFCRLQSINLTI